MNLPIFTIGLIFIPVLPTLLQDVLCEAEKWGNDGKSGRIDPFVEIFDVRIPLEIHIFSGLRAEFSFPARVPHDC